MTVDTELYAVNWPIMKERTFAQGAAKVSGEPRLPDCRIAAKVRFREVNTLVPVNTVDTEPYPIGSLLQCGFPKPDIGFNLWCKSAK